MFHFCDGSHSMSGDWRARTVHPRAGVLCPWFYLSHCKKKFLLQKRRQSVRIMISWQQEDLSAALAYSGLSPPRIGLASAKNLGRCSGSSPHDDHARHHPVVCERHRIIGLEEFRSREKFKSIYSILLLNERSKKMRPFEDGNKTKRTVPTFLLCS